MNLLKKIIKDEMNEEEKNYFGKRKMEWKWKTTIITVKGLKVMMKVKVMQRLKERK